MITRDDINLLCDLSAAGLRRMYLPQRRRFCHREIWSPAGRPMAEGESFRYTAMSLIGLLAARRGGRAMGWKETELTAIQESLYATRRDEANPGDWGLLLWTLAAGGHRSADGVCREIAERIDGRRPVWDLRDVGSMELAFLLSGLASHLEAVPGSERAASTADAMAGALLSRRDPATGYFYGIPPRSGRLAALRRRINSFAAQIYPVYALARHSERSGDEACLAAARSCADRLIAQRARGGGWCWQYDVPTGRVVETYPIYSVHQDGMAPMALRRLARACGEAGQDYERHAADGLRWLRGENELDRDMLDTDRQTIWRAIRRRGRGRLNPSILLNSALALAGCRANRSMPGGYELVAECRPYHLGWVLLAWS